MELVIRRQECVLAKMVIVVEIVPENLVFGLRQYFLLVIKLVVVGLKLEPLHVELTSSPRMNPNVMQITNQRPRWSAT